MQLEQLGKVRLAQQAHQRTRAHLAHVVDPQVVGDERADAPPRLVGHLQPPADRGRHFGPNRLVAVEADALGAHHSRWLANVVQQRAPSQLSRRLVEVFKQTLNVGPHIAFGVEFRVLWYAPHDRDFRQHGLQQARPLQKAQAAPRPALSQQQGQLVAEALGTDASNALGPGAERVPRRGFNGKAEPGLKAHGPQQAQIVFGKAHGRIANGADDLSAEVLLPAHVIEERGAGRVVEQAVDGKVAALGVGAGVGAHNGGGTTSIAVRAVAAKARDLVGTFVEHHQGDAKLDADRHRVFKERGHLFWLGIRSHIPVLGHAPQYQVAYATPREQGSEAGPPQGLDDALSTSVYICIHPINRLSVKSTIRLLK